MPLTPQEEENAKAIFDALDADGSGKITVDNIKSALESAGFALTDEEIEVRKSGQINFIFALLYKTNMIS